MWHVCDWYNPVKGHAQYSLRDKRRDRHSGRIWRITTKGNPLQEPPPIARASLPELLEILKRPEYRYRYWAKRELRERDPVEVKVGLDAWVADLEPNEPRFRHHQVEAIWAYRNVDALNTQLLQELLACDERHARAAATRQLRYWHTNLPNAIELLRAAANDPSGLVRMEAAIAASYVGSKEALDAILDVFKHPREKHLAYAINCALGSAPLRRHCEGNPDYNVTRLLKMASRVDELKEPSPSASHVQFDSQKDLKLVNLSCRPERMLYSVNQFAVTTGQPVKLVFTNSDATDHNLLIVRPGTLAEVGMAANEMAKDPKHANSDFIPQSKRHLILEAAPMIGPTRRTRVHVLRFDAPTEPGLYPFVCTFPGHWVVMNGVMVVVDDLQDVEAMLAAQQPTIVNVWTMADFSQVTTHHDEQSVMRGMQAFMKARCNQCHVVAGHGINLGPDLSEVVKNYQGAKLLRQLLEPSAEINEKYRSYQIMESSGKVVSGVIGEENEKMIRIIPNLLSPDITTVVRKDEIEFKTASKLSSMPAGMLNVLTKEEIIDLLSYLEAGGYQLPAHLEQTHQHE